MARYTHSILAALQTPAADGVQVFDLPVNPLTVVLLHLNPLNETTAIADYAWVRALLSAVDNVTVSFRGGAFIALSGLDLMALNMMWHRYRPWQ